MSTIKRFVAASLAGASMVVLGCSHTEDRNIIGETNAQPRSVDAMIVDRLANARCNREQACDNIGDGKKYGSRQVCMDQLRGGIGNDLNSYKCPGGLDGSAVNRCTTAIGNEECGVHPMESMTRVDECRSGAMCVH